MTFMCPTPCLPCLYIYAWYKGIEMDIKKPMSLEQAKTKKVSKETIVRIRPPMKPYKLPEGWKVINRKDIKIVGKE